MVVLKIKLRSSTLIEALVAMVIIVVVYGISVMVFLNISRSSNTLLKTEASAVLEKIRVETTKQYRFMDEKYGYDLFTIIKTVTQHPSCDNLKVINYEIRDNRDNLLMDLNELIYIRK